MDELPRWMPNTKTARIGAWLERRNRLWLERMFYMAITVGKVQHAHLLEARALVAAADRAFKRPGRSLKRLIKRRDSLLHTANEAYRHAALTLRRPDVDAEYIAFIYADPRNETPEAAKAKHAQFLEYRATGDSSFLLEAARLLAETGQSEKATEHYTRAIEDGLEGAAKQYCKFLASRDDYLTLADFAEDYATNVDPTFYIDAAEALVDALDSEEMSLQVEQGALDHAYNLFRAHNLFHKAWKMRAEGGGRAFAQFLTDRNQFEQAAPIWEEAGQQEKLRGEEPISFFHAAKCFALSGGRERAYELIILAVAENTVERSVEFAHAFRDAGDNTLAAEVFARLGNKTRQPEYFVSAIECLKVAGIEAKDLLELSAYEETISHWSSHVEVPSMPNSRGSLDLI